MKRLIAILVTAAAPLAIVACHRSSSQTASIAPSASSESPIHSISLPHYQPDLPIAPGREVFASSCLSCHSPRYIITQPAMPAAKWEATVKKMIANYGAPVAEDQIATIVQYIVAAKENGPRDPWDALAVETPADLPTVDLSHADATRGATIFSRSCAPCHGATGVGDGPGAKVMLPRPTDLTAGRMTASAIFAVVQHGVRGAAMPAAADLSVEQINDVVAYTMKLQSGSNLSALSSASADAASLFGANCTSCHGALGMGDGPASPALARRPANFHVKQPGADYAYRAITEGIAGSSMPAWKSKLDEHQRRALAEYVRTFYSASEAH